MTRPREINVWQRTFIFALSIQFLLGVAMTASPWLHARLHHDANKEHHECVVTVMHSGGVDGPMSAPVLVPGFHPAPQFVAVANVSSYRIPSIFLRACVFEHAPPSLG
jgi:hypothetical protein